MILQKKLSNWNSTLCAHVGQHVRKFPDLRWTYIRLSMLDMCTVMARLLLFHCPFLRMRIFCMVASHGLLMVVRRIAGRCLARNIRLRIQRICLFLGGLGDRAW